LELLAKAGKSPHLLTVEAEGDRVAVVIDAAGSLRDDVSDFDIGSAALVAEAADSRTSNETLALVSREMDTLDYHAICLDTRQRLLAPLSARADVGDEMEKRVSLCPMCDHCPEVALVGDEIQIGEKGDLVVLKKDEWNVLVEAIKSGRLSKV